MIPTYFIALASLLIQSPAPQKAEGTLRTRWGEAVYQTYSPDNLANLRALGKPIPTPLPEYPRPQMVRSEWTNLNGQWWFRIGKPTLDDLRSPITVPYPVESQLSQQQLRVPDGEPIVYSRSFIRPKGERVLLHFGAVDWHTSVTVNGKLVGEHKGGYDAFSFDITNSLNPTGAQELEVIVLDPTDKGMQPRGKQVVKPEGIFYTPTSGIWQTVWLEGVNQAHLDRLWATGDTKGLALINTESLSCPGYRLTAEISDHGKRIVKSFGKVGTPTRLQVPSPKLWSPSSAYLYPLKVTIQDTQGKVVDQVKSYVAFREVKVGKAADGKTRILLNGKPVFLAGPLDQGFWPDGLYTAPTDEALRYDIEVTKRLGFNTIRKHVKVEPDRWYYWCDKLGIAVLQDMPSTSGFIGGDDPDYAMKHGDSEQYTAELRAMMEGLRSHPSILMWIPFNEGWGQHDTSSVVEYVKNLDPTRLVNNASGWTDRGVGSVHDIHVYPGPASPQPEATRAAMLGEFGGLGLNVPGHNWKATGWGYQSFKTSDELTDRFVGIMNQLHVLVGDQGLSCAIYTQTTDVETESNGLMTYDRAMIKMDEKRITSAIKALQLPPPATRVIVPSSQKQPQSWSFSFVKPTATSRMSTGAGGFGTKGTPGAVVRTVWDTPDIWIQRNFEITKPVRARIWIHHDEDAEVFIDGKLVRRFSGYTSSYMLDDKEIDLTRGKHHMLIHCHQTRGGQYIDAGLMEVVK